MEKNWGDTPSATLSAYTSQQSYSYAPVGFNNFKSTIKRTFNTRITFY